MTRFIYTALSIYSSMKKLLLPFSSFLMNAVFIFLAFSIPILTTYSTSENRYKHEAMINGEPVIFEILDTCPKVSQL